MKTWRSIASSIVIIAAASCVCASDNGSSTAEPDIHSLSTFGTAGKELHILGGGKEAELFHHEGRGCLTHMWFGGSWPGYDHTRMRGNGE